MAMQLPVIYDGQLQRKLMPGDIVGSFEPAIPATDTTNTTLAVTAAMLLAGVYVRNPAGVSTDTYPTASDLITALQTAYQSTDLPVGLTFRWRVINLSANLITGAVTANTGVTMTRGNIAASTTKDFLIRITNSSPQQTCLSIGSTNASAVLTGFTDAQIQALSIGMVCTTATANLQGQTIIGINRGNNSVTMSGNANATQSQTITFSPTYTITGLAA